MKMKIGIKILLLLLAVSIVSLSVMSIIGISGMYSIQKTSADTNDSFVDNLVTGTETALGSLAQSQLRALVDEKAEVVDSTLWTLAGYVDVLSRSMTKIYTHPESHYEIALPIAGDTGISAKLLYSEAADRLKDGPVIQSQVNLLSQLQDQLVAVHETNAMIGATYVTTHDGVSVVADVDSNYWVNADGAVKNYESTTRPWYAGAVLKGDIYFSSITPDSLGKGPGIMIGKPFYDSGGNIAGAVGLGAYLTDIGDIVKNTQIGETGYGFIINAEGQVLLTAKTGGELSYSSQDNPVDLRQSHNQQLADAVSAMLTSKKGGCQIKVDGVDVYLAHAYLEKINCSFGIVVEVSEIMQPAQKLESQIISLADKTSASIDQTIFYVILLFVIVVVVMQIASVIAAIVLSRRLTRPIVTLQKKVKEISNGNLEMAINIQSGDEVQELGEAFLQMTVELKKYIENLAKTTAEKERIGAELNVATRIQASMLPCIFPPFPERKEFDIYASMLPAKEVGGDFYDFFLIDENKLAIVIADVSGKGVPAALFMVIAKTLIKNNAQYGKTPKEVFETVNNLLCENNEAGMFVTAFMGYVDIPTGSFTYVNAGHNPPLIKRAGGCFEWLPTKPGFVLAGMDDMFYKQGEIQLSAGDTVFLYTDGVTEAIDKDDRLFTESKLLEVSNDYKDCGLKELLISVKREIDAFADGAEQADDITMLALMIAGGEL